ncbi:hypothetical protein [Streptomyces sp. NPDC048611]|uniref:DUF7341 domain-containing protein n=1 Tax=Streptomyces sp. NPDC048611 TaxID=3155635 RepID=UPI00341DE48A
MSDRLAELINQLTKGWTERREFKVLRNRQAELRIETITHPPLLAELFTKTTVDVMAAGGDIVGGGGKPGSRPPGSLEAADLIEAIRQLARDTRRRWAPGVRLNVPAGRELQRCLALVEQADPSEVAQFEHELRHLVRRARIFLGYDSAPRNLWERCGCGGTLTVLQDNDGLPEKIKCTGTRENLPCGAESPRHMWLELLHQLESNYEHDDQ